MVDATRFHMPRLGLPLLCHLYFFCGAITLAGVAVKIHVVPEASQSAGQSRYGSRALLQHPLSRKNNLSRRRKNLHRPRCLTQLIQSAIHSMSSQSQNLFDQLGIVFAIVMSFILTLVLLLYFLIDGQRLGRGMM